jgi:hypothetical protein
MVKRIRVKPTKINEEKVEVQELNQGDENLQATSVGTENADDIVEANYQEPQASDLEKELQEMAQKDEFSHIGSNIFLNLVNQWRVWAGLAVMSVLAAGIYQIVITGNLHDNVEAFTSFKETQKSLKSKLVDQQIYQQSQIKALSATSTEETSSNTAQPKAVEASAFKAEADALARFAKEYKGKNIENSALLAQATALFNAAQSADDFVQTAKLYADLYAKSGLDSFVRAIAVQNQAICFEKAAAVSTDAQKKGFLGQAYESWGKLAALSKIYSLSAQINQARILEQQGDRDAAKKAYEKLQADYKEDLNKPENNGYAQQIKIAAARL